MNEWIALSLDSKACVIGVYIFQISILELRVWFPSGISHSISSLSICKVEAAAMNEFNAMWYTQFKKSVCEYGRGQNNVEHIYNVGFGGGPYGTVVGKMFSLAR